MTDFWQRPDIVEQFANRDPDHRLMAWCEAHRVQGLPVLDIGCAGGRNTVYLAQQGADVHAIDASRAMVAKTRARLTDIGITDVEARVVESSMTNMAHLADNAFDWVIALGVYHTASSFEAWQQAVRETARVLKPGGDLLFSQFAPGSAPGGSLLTPVAGQEHLFAGNGRYHLLLTAAEVDSLLAQAGLLPVVETNTVDVNKGGSRRVSVNGHYRLEVSV
jgi:SAM-dependent methyltransferase